MIKRKYIFIMIFIYGIIAAMEYDEGSGGALGYTQMNNESDQLSSNETLRHNIIILESAYFYIITPCKREQWKRLYPVRIKALAEKHINKCSDCQSYPKIGEWWKKWILFPKEQYLIRKVICPYQDVVTSQGRSCYYEIPAKQHYWYQILDTAQSLKEHIQRMHPDKQALTAKECRSIVMNCIESQTSAQKLSEDSSTQQLNRQVTFEEAMIVPEIKELFGEQSSFLSESE